MSDTIPDGWRVCELSETLAEEFPGAWGSDPALKPANVSVLRSTNLDDEGHVDYSTGARRYFLPPELNKKALVDGDILLEASGGGPGKPVGRVARFSDPGDGTYASSNFFRTLRACREVDSGFLAWVLQRAYQQPDIWQFQQQTTGIINLKYKDYLRQPVTLPEITEQRRIAAILDTADEAIRSAERLIAKFEKTRSGLAGAIFPILRRNPQGGNASGRSMPLGDAGVWLSGGTPMTSNPSYWNGTIPWISAASLQSFGIQDSDRRVTEAGASHGTRMVQEGAVIFVVRGMSLKSEFRVGVTRCRVAFGQDCKAIIPRLGVDAAFLAHSLKANDYRILRLVDEAGHGTGRLETKLIQHLTIEIPSLEEQQRLVGVIGSVDRELSALRDERAKLRLVKQGLMDDLLTGRVRVRDGVGASA